MQHRQARIAILLICVLGALPAAADTKVTTQEGTGIAGDSTEMPEELRQAFANQEPTTAVYWFGKDRAARVSDTGAVISRLDRGESYVVNHQGKSFSVIELGGGDDSPLANAESGLVRTSETRKIGSWNTVRYDMTVDMMGEGEINEITLWVSDEVDIDLSAYRALIKATAAQMGSEWMLKFLEVDGYPVRQEFKIGPILAWQELVEISDEAPPEGTYEPPAGYTRSE